MCVQPGNVRWVSITGVDAALIVRLANKYNLRMLQVRVGTPMTAIRTDRRRRHRAHAHGLLHGYQLGAEPYARVVA